MQYKTDNVVEAVWVGCAILAYKRYLELSMKFNRESFWFSQAEIQNIAQGLCSKTVQNARINQWVNGDHHNNSYNYLRENRKLRRLTARGEFHGIKEIPEDLSEKGDHYILVNNEQRITIGELLDWVANNYSLIISRDINVVLEPKKHTEVHLPMDQIKDEKIPTTDKLELEPKLELFLSRIKDGQIEVYNEFSIQFELAMFLREILDKQYKIQLERNISYFGLDKVSFLKKEMDVVIFNGSKSERYCIEIKFPTNGQYPEQMFSICKDIKFLEQLKENGFAKSYELVIVNSDVFLINKGGSEIYEMFRKDKSIRGRIIKPTGQRDEEVMLSNEYKLGWVDLSGDLKGLIISV